MATGHCYSVALEGVRGRPVTVEADISNGVPGWALSGLPDTVVTQARDRCRAAMINSGHEWPDRRVTVAMYPADVRKVGAHYDLAIALALLVANNAVPSASLRDTGVFGELALDGRLRAMPGVLPAVLAAREAGLTRVLVPEPNAAEAGLVEGVEVVAVRSLAECVAVLTGAEPPPDVSSAPLRGQFGSGGLVIPDRLELMDLADVRGQALGRWCVEVAAAGAHHLFLEGPPGAGKTMLAERIPRLLPDLDLARSLEVSTIHSIAGRLSRDQPLVVRPPFLAPNHGDTVPSVIGGGGRTVLPGAVSLAHLGVLFMDEAPEFRPTVHDALRQPLQSGEIIVRRAEGSATFPARFLLVLAANPCPCGLADAMGSAGCTCAPMRRRRYRDRISGPVRDRIDITHRVGPVSRAEMREQATEAGGSRAVAGRVAEARARQRARFRDLPWQTNGEVPGVEFHRRCPLAVDAATAVEVAVDAAS